MIGLVGIGAKVTEGIYREDSVQDGAGVDFFVGEPAEGGGRTATAPRPKYVSVASHISARTT